MGRGYIKLDRALENWRFKTKPNYVALWVHLLLEANHQSNKYMDTQIERGQLTTSLEALKKGTGLSLQQIRTILNKLNNDEITIKSTNKYTLITIVNYDKYQSSTKKINKQNNIQENKNLTINQQTNNKQITTNKNVNNVINIKNKRDINIRLKKLLDLGMYEEAELVKDFVDRYDPDYDSYIKIEKIVFDPNVRNKDGYIAKMMKGNV